MLLQLANSLHRALGGTWVLGLCFFMSHQTKQLGVEGQDWDH